MRIPLHIVLLAHPDSPVLRSNPDGIMDDTALGTQLLRRLYGAPATLELSIRTWFGRALPDGTPPPLDQCWSGEAEATLLVYLLDARMARRVSGGTALAWGEHLRQAITEAEANPRVRSVVPLALDAKGFDVVPDDLRRSVREVPPGRRLDTVLQHVAVRGLYLLSERTPPQQPGRLQAPIQVFVSHAKADLKQVQIDPVHQMLAALQDHAVERFFDSARIGPGEDFAERLEHEVRGSDVMLVVWTDAWSSRPWCRRELLTAKAAGRTVVVVDALQESSSRAFPYVGNATWVRWRGHVPQGDRAPEESDLETAASERSRVFAAVVLAAMRDRFERRALGPPADCHTIHLGSAPEALDFAGRADVHTFVYPDPPLPDEERVVLSCLAGERTLVTPLGRIARAGRPPNVHEVVVSVSSPGGAALRRLGLDVHHVDALTDTVHLGVLLAGLRIVYGGLVNYTSSGPSNYVMRLFDVVRRYGDLAQDLGKPWKAPVVNFPPWPLHLSYGDQELNLFGKLAQLELAPRPDLGTLPYEPWPAGTWPEADDMPRLLAIGLGLREMRRRATQPVPGGRVRPRILIGGPVVSMGWLPGLVEEALCSLRIGAPLYILGAYGGAAKVVAELLLNGVEADEPVMTEQCARSALPPRLGASAFDDARALASDFGLPFDTRADVAAEISRLGGRGLSAALNNGLSDEENRELLEARDGRHILHLVLRGLAALPSPLGATSPT